MVIDRPGEDPENREQTALARGAVLHEVVGRYERGWPGLSIRSTSRDIHDEK